MEIKLWYCTDFVPLAMENLASKKVMPARLECKRCQEIARSASALEMYRKCWADPALQGADVNAHVELATAECARAHDEILKIDDAFCRESDTCYDRSSESFAELRALVHDSEASPVMTKSRAAGTWNFKGEEHLLTWADSTDYAETWRDCPRDGRGYRRAGWR